jgi:hypothetical protein
MGRGLWASAYPSLKFLKPTVDKTVDKRMPLTMNCAAVSY